MRIAMTVVSTLLVGGCATSWTPAELSAASDTRLCSTFAVVLHYNGKYRKDLMDEITKRKLIRSEFQSAVDSGDAKIGMTPIEAVCAWSSPTRVNKTTSLNGVMEQWVFEYGGAVGRPTFNFLYFRDGYVVSIQE